MSEKTEPPPVNPEDGESTSSSSTLASKNKNKIAVSLQDSAMLEKIDRLFACNVKRLIGLPQIVVVGDQSSGKSSVLAGLTDLPFAQGSDLCTRFATQITFLRTPEKNITVSISADASSSAEYAQRVNGWTKEVTCLDETSFGEIMSEVHGAMQLWNPEDGNDQTDQKQIPKTFSGDVLRIEVCGPDQEHFSVIDVPGIFKSTTLGLTSKSDIEMVKSMVEAYMRNPRSVILAVIPANVDIATQEILEMVKELDQGGERILGVLTKPDLVDRGAETMVIDLIEGRREPLALGRHLVRNLGQLESQDQSINHFECEKTFFETKHPFNMLPKHKVRILALRLRLQEVLADHIRSEFPKVKLELNKILKEKRVALERMGPSRNSTEEQVKYLMEIAMRFQELTALALDAKYSADQLFDGNHTLRLATCMMRRSQTFSEFVDKFGHTYAFQKPIIAVDDNMELSSRAPENPGSNRHELSKMNDAAEASPTPSVRIEEEHGDIREILPNYDNITEPLVHGILDWLLVVYRDSRGSELGTFNPSVLASAMREQSKNWGGLARGYISDAVTILHTFITELLRLLCPNERVRSGVSRVLMDTLLDRYKRTIDQVDFILKVENGAPATQNHYFNDTLDKCRQKRMQEAVAAKAIDTGAGLREKVVRISDMPTLNPMSNETHMVRDIHDVLQSYYQVARKRTVDVVCMQAVDYHLISGAKTPLKLFCPSFVADLSFGQLEEIAGEVHKQKHLRGLSSRLSRSLRRARRS